MKNMLRYKTKTRPGLVALYDIRPGNGAGPFLQPRSPHGASWHETSGLPLRYCHTLTKADCAGLSMVETCHQFYCTCLSGDPANGGTVPITDFTTGIGSVVNTKCQRAFCILQSASDWRRSVRC